jgi:hypothetical protein
MTKKQKTTNSLIDDATASMTKKIGVSKTMPKGEARALGTPAPKRSKKALRLVPAAVEQAEAAQTEQPENISAAPAEIAGQTPTDVVVSEVAAITLHDSEEKKEKTMTLTFKNLNKKQTQAIYSGIRGAVRFPLSAFENRQAPQTLDVTGPFAEAAKPKAQMSAEERKAARAAAPKPTLAEKIAKREAQLQRLREKAATEAQAGQQASL